MTPEPAPLPQRTAAFLLDQLVVVLVVVPPALALGTSIEDLVRPGQARTLAFLAAMGVAFVYHFTFEWLTGRTVGKSILGLRVVADDGTPLGVRGSFLRNALRLIDGLGYWSVAVVIILYRGDGKRLGDILGRTLVVETPPSQ